MQAPFPLVVGSFELQTPIGRGGVGEVWRAHHRHLGTTVAIKFITNITTTEPQLYLNLREELRAIAGMDHPHVIQVYDHGDVGPELSRATGGRLVAGSPWFAMEYASGGSLLMGGRPRDWASLKSVLLALLGALAHAHARGIVHLDLKPDNVLVCGPSTTRSGLKLSDFGMAHVFGRKARGGNADVVDMAVTASSLDRSGRLAGTPWYMAPEQFAGQWRDFGPWTDLYALGCLVYTLLTGRPPFAYNTMSSLAQAHCFQPLPPLHSPFPLPDGFTEWLSLLSAKAPQDRFQHCADAAWALQKLGSPREVLATFAPRPVVHAGGKETDDQGETLAWDAPPGSAAFLAAMATQDVGEAPDTATLEWTREIDVVTNDVDQETRVVPVGRRAIVPVAPQLPETWRPEYQAGHDSVFWRMTHHLYGIRSIPLVGREAERDVLWRHLGDVHRQRVGAVLVLQGVAGTGKSRLVEWLAERAEEVGGARALKAIHSVGGGPEDGLVPMFLRALMCIELPLAEASDRIAKTVQRLGGRDPFEWEALTELLRPGLTTLSSRPSAQSSRRLVRSASQRYAVFYHFLVHLSEARPVIVWLDDAQWGPDAVGFARYVAEVQETRPSRVLVVLTVRDEAIKESELVSWQLADLVGLEYCRRLLIEPLSSDVHQTLVRELLGLEVGLARQVQERTAGNPLFAVQLVGDWVRRSLLSYGPTGFVLQNGVGVELPDDIHQLWIGQISYVFSGLPPEYVMGVELAAVLGQTIDEEEWIRAAEVMGLSLPKNLLELLLDRRLVQRSRVPEGSGKEVQIRWSFIHGMLRESLVRQALEGGRDRRYHEAACQVLGAPDASLEQLERRGRHLLAANYYAEAMDVLHSVARALFRIYDSAHASRVMDLWAEARARGQVPLHQRRLAEGMVTRVLIDSRLGQLERAESWGHEVLELARQFCWVEIEAHILTMLGVVKLTQGDYTNSLSLSAEACRLWEGVGDQVGIGIALGNLAEARLSRMDLDGAWADYTRAREVNELAGRNDGVAAAVRGLATVAWYRHDMNTCAQLHEEAYGLLGQDGDQKSLGDSVRALGHVAARGNNFDVALEHYRHALAIYQRISHRPLEAKSWNDIAEVYRGRGDLASAEECYRRALSLAPNVVAQVNLGNVLVGRGHYAAAEKCLEECRVRIEKSGNLQLLGAVYSGLLACAAGQADRTKWRAAFSRVQELGGEAHMIEDEDIHMVKRAADLAHQMGAPDLGAEATALARQLKVNPGVV